MRTHPAASGPGTVLAAPFRRRSNGGRVVRALDEVSLQLAPGARVGVIGRNGAGKSCLLRVIAGSYEPTRGRVVRRGRASSPRPVAPQGRVATGYHSVIAQGIGLGLSQGEIEARVDEIAAFSGLGDRLEMAAKHYSNAMLARLAFAVNACLQPEILLIDEWVSNLDVEFMAKVERHVRELSERSRIFVLASHRPELLSRLCSTGAVLEAGRLKALEPIDEAVRRI